MQAWTRDAAFVAWACLADDSTLLALRFQVRSLLHAVASVETWQPWSGAGFSSALCIWNRAGGRSVDVGLYTVCRLLPGA
jgi:hypothetical protein